MARIGFRLHACRVDARSLRAPGTGRGIAVYLERLLDRASGVAARRTASRTVTGGRVRSASAAAVGRPRLDRVAGRLRRGLGSRAGPTRGVGRSAVRVDAARPLLRAPALRIYSRYERLWHRLARPRRLAERAAQGDHRVGGGARRGDRGVGTRLRTRGHGPLGTRPAARGAAGSLPAAARARLRAGRGRTRAPKAPGAAHRGAQAARKRAASARSSCSRATASHPRAARRAVARAFSVASTTRHSRRSTPAHSPSPVPFARGGLRLHAARGGALAARPPWSRTSRRSGRRSGTARCAVAPDDPDALADALLRVEREPELRERLAVAGRDAAAHLSWERAARETRAVLAAAARGRSA